MISAGDIRQIAGLLEGEGTFRFNLRTPQIRLGMTDYDVVLAAHVLMQHRHQIRIRIPNADRGLPMFIIEFNGEDAASWMMTLYKHMGQRRRESIRRALASWRTTKIEQRKRTHCPRGHPYDQTFTLSTRPDKVYRRCARCQRAAQHKIWWRPTARERRAVRIPYLKGVSEGW